ncbi:hypothetical protein, partial [Cyclobacterium salsum]|uniref:hypothetical protein n=1 Tax=Cyclobacterium salsum TaxID=2666329 RepID=UPI00192EBAFC
MKIYIYIWSLLISFSLYFLFIPSFAQPTNQWDKTIGGNNTDYLQSTTPTPDGGYLLAGSSYSSASGDKTENNKGGWDYWAVKIDGSGNKV